MQIRVLFFGVLRDLVGRPSETIELPAGARVQQLLEHYAAASTSLRQMLPSVALSVNEEYAGAEQELRTNDEVALLPPVSGGSHESQMRARLVRSPITTNEVLESLKSPEDGAAVVFEGIVRNNTRGRRTLYLDYDSYEGMALKQMESLVAEARERFKIRDAAIVHRLGRLEIGETSVLIVVASGHRGPAFEACRWMIDTLKKTVPIWKKEHFVDGAVWADGEPFPEEIARLAGTSATEAAS